MMRFSNHPDRERNESEKKKSEKRRREKERCARRIYGIRKILINSKPQKSNSAREGGRCYFTKIPPTFVQIYFNTSISIL